MSRRSFENFIVLHQSGKFACFNVMPAINFRLRTVTIDKFTFSLQDVKNVKLNRNSKTVLIDLVGSSEYDSEEEFSQFTESVGQKFFGV